MNFFTHIFEGFQLDFKLLFILLFLGIISQKGALRFNRGAGGVFEMRGFIFKSEGGVPHEGGISFNGGFSKKIVGWVGAHAPPPPLWETLQGCSKVEFQRPFFLGSFSEIMKMFELENFAFKLYCGHQNNKFEYMYFTIQMF